MARIAITGSTGLIGSALVDALRADGHEITRVVRSESSGRGVLWDPQHGSIEHAKLEGHDAAVHLAGESLAGLWTSARKRRIRESRERGTRLLATSLNKLDRPPAVLVSASAIGIYGDRDPQQPIDEESDRGRGFLADVVEVWERATDAARDAGIRVVNTRFGLVLSAQGGALAAMMPLFKLGLGGKLGSGRQMWSWVALADVVGAIRFAIASPGLAGPVNVVAPSPVTNAVFTRTLGRVLGRPTVMVAPEALLKAIAGDMAEEMLLSGVRVVPRKLQEAGYEFRYPVLEGALKHVLGR